MNETMPPVPPPAAPPFAQLRPPHRFSLIWLIPLIAAAIALYLAYTTISARGPLITITFLTGDGLQAGQTRVEHKSVAVGTVDSVRLSRDMRQVIVKVRMQADATHALTSHAQFWVVRPRLTAGNVSGLETLVSGAYIEFDPGVPGGKPQDRFTGLEEPPGVLSDEPGSTFNLVAQRLDSIGPGSPVFYRGIVVGEVLNYDEPSLDAPITVHAFVRKPFDSYVHQGTRFWNASGVSLNFGPQGLHFAVQNVQAVLAGGIAFNTPTEARGEPAASAGTVFTLYPDYDSATAAGLHENIPMVAYFDDAVSGLEPNSPVEFLGQQIGTVTSIGLRPGPNGRPRVRVRFDVQPERVFPPDMIHTEKTLDSIRALVAQGARVQVQSASFLTGQSVLAVDFFTDAPPATVTLEGHVVVVPTEAGGMQNITNTASNVLAKINSLPLQQIADNLNDTLKNLDQTVGSDELKQSLRSLSATMTEMQELVRNTNQGLSPTLQRLPAIATELQRTLAQADHALGAVNVGYGGGSDFHHNLNQLMLQIGDAVRSIRLLANYLDQHPEALIRGRSDSATGQ
jgi:paraquat-inducible protein B